MEALPHHLQDLKDLLGALLVPNPTARIYRSCGVLALMSQSCLVAQGEPTEYYTGGFKVRCILHQLPALSDNFHIFGFTFHLLLQSRLQS